MTPRQAALQAQRHADQNGDHDSRVSWEDVADGYTVAADAWLEAGEPEEAAHQLLRAAEYRRRALDDRGVGLSRLPFGITLSAINMETGKIDPAYVWEWRALPILTLDEAEQIAALAGWLEPHSLYERGGLLAYAGLPAPLPWNDRNGRPNEPRVTWLELLTRGSTYISPSDYVRPRPEDFRRRLYQRRKNRRIFDRDPSPRGRR